MANNLQLRVTADIADAQAKLAVLNAEFRTTQAEINALARAGAAGSLDQAGAQQLQALTARSLELQAAAAPLASTVAEAGFAVRGLGASAVRAGRDVEGLAHHNATAVRYSRELFDELSSGRTRYLPSTLAALAQQTFHVNIGMLAAAGGAAALVAGLGYLAYESIKTKDALEHLTSAAHFSGNLDATYASVSGLVDVMTRFGSVGHAEALKIAGAFERISGVSQSTMGVLAASVHQVGELMGTSDVKAASLLAKYFSLDQSATALATQFHGLSPAQMDAARAADASGNAAQVQAAKITVLREALSGLMGELKQKQAEYRAGINQALTAPTANYGIAQGQVDQYQSQIQSLQQVINALSGEGSTLGAGGGQQVLKLGVSLALKSDSNLRERTGLETHIKQLMDARAEAIKEGNKTDLNLLDQAIAEQRQKLAELDRAHARKTANGAHAGYVYVPHAESTSDASRTIADDGRILNALQADAERRTQLAQQVNAIQEGAARSHAQAMLQIKIQQLRTEEAEGQIGHAQELADEQKLYAQEYAQQMTAYQRELAVDGLKVTEKARIYAEIEALHDQHVLKMTESSLAAAQGQIKAAQATVEPIISAVNTSINGVIMGTQTMQMAVGNILDSIMLKFIDHEAKKVILHFATENAMTLATITGATERWIATEAAEAKTLALKILTAGKTIAIDAAQAAAGAFKALAGIPVVGPILGAAAAAAVFMEVKNLAHFDVGAWSIPHDGVGMLHAGEMVLPPPQSEALRGALAGRGSGVGSGAGGDTYHVQIHSPDAEGFERLLRNSSDAVVRVVHELARGGAFA